MVIFIPSHFRSTPLYKLLSEIDFKILSSENTTMKPQFKWNFSRRKIRKIKFAQCLISEVLKVLQFELEAKGAASTQCFRRTCPYCKTVHNCIWLVIKERPSVVRLQTVGPDNKATDLFPAISYQADTTELGKADARSPSTQPQISIWMRL